MLTAEQQTAAQEQAQSEEHASDLQEVVLPSIAPAVSSSAELERSGELFERLQELGGKRVAFELYWAQQFAQHEEGSNAMAELQEEHLAASSQLEGEQAEYRALLSEFGLDPAVFEQNITALAEEALSAARMQERVSSVMEASAQMARLIAADVWDYGSDFDLNLDYMHSDELPGEEEWQLENRLEFADAVTEEFEALIEQYPEELNLEQLQEMHQQVMRAEVVDHWLQSSARRRWEDIEQEFIDGCGDQLVSVEQAQQQHTQYRAELLIEELAAGRFEWAFLSPFCNPQQDGNVERRRAAARTQTQAAYEGLVDLAEKNPELIDAEAIELLWREQETSGTSAAAEYVAERRAEAEQEYADRGFGERLADIGLEALESLQQAVEATDYVVGGTATQHVGFLEGLATLRNPFRHARDSAANYIIRHREFWNETMPGDSLFDDDNVDFADRELWQAGLAMHPVGQLSDAVFAPAFDSLDLLKDEALLAVINGDGVDISYDELQQLQEEDRAFKTIDRIFHAAELTAAIAVTLATGGSSGQTALRSVRRMLGVSGGFASANALAQELISDDDFNIERFLDTTLAGTAHSAMFMGGMSATRRAWLQLRVGGAIPQNPAQLQALRLTDPQRYMRVQQAMQEAAQITQAADFIDAQGDLVDAAAGVTEIDSWESLAGVALQIGVAGTDAFDVRLGLGGGSASNQDSDRPLEVAFSINDRIYSGKLSRNHQILYMESDEAVQALFRDSEQRRLTEQGTNSDDAGTTAQSNSDSLVAYYDPIADALVTPETGTSDSAESDAIFSSLLVRQFAQQQGASAAEANTAQARFLAQHGLSLVSEEGRFEIRRAAADTAAMATEIDTTNNLSNQPDPTEETTTAPSERTPASDQQEAASLLGVRPPEPAPEVIAEVRRVLAEELGLDSISELSDEQIEEQYLALARSYHSNLRQADYSAEGDHAANIEEWDIDGIEGIEMDGRQGWVVHSPEGMDATSPLGPRYSLNVRADPQLITELDEFALRHGVKFKFASNDYDWETRHDPVTVYSGTPLSAEAEQELAQLIAPYARAEEGLIGEQILDDTGQEISGAIRRQEVPRPQDVGALIDRAGRLDPALARHIAEDILTRYFAGYGGPSAGQYVAAQQLVEMLENRTADLSRDQSESSQQIDTTDNRFTVNPLEVVLPDQQLSESQQQLMQSWEGAQQRLILQLLNDPDVTIEERKALLSELAESVAVHARQVLDEAGVEYTMNGPHTIVIRPRATSSETDVEQPSIQTTDGSNVEIEFTEAETPLNEYAKRMWNTRGVLLQYNPYDLLNRRAGAVYRSSEQIISLPTASILHGDNSESLYHEKVHAVFDAMEREGADSILFGHFTAVESGSIWPGRPIDSGYNSAMSLSELATFTEGAALYARAVLEQQRSSPATAEAEPETETDSEDQFDRWLEEMSGRSEPAPRDPLIVGLERNITLLGILARKTELLLSTEALANQLASSDGLSILPRDSESGPGGSRSRTVVDNAILHLPITSEEQEAHLLEQTGEELGIADAADNNELHQALMHALYTDRIERLRGLASSVAAAAEPVVLAHRAPWIQQQLPDSEMAQLALELQALVSPHYPAHAPDLNVRELITNDPQALAHLLEHCEISDAIRSQLIEESLLAFIRSPGIAGRTSESAAQSPIEQLSLQTNEFVSSSECSQEVQTAFCQQLANGQLHMFDAMPGLLPTEILETPEAKAALETALLRLTTDDLEQHEQIRQLYEDLAQGQIFSEVAARLEQANAERAEQIRQAVSDQSSESQETASSVNSYSVNPLDVVTHDQPLSETQQLLADAWDTAKREMRMHPWVADPEGRMERRRCAFMEGSKISELARQVLDESGVEYTQIDGAIIIQPRVSNSETTIQPPTVQTNDGSYATVPFTEAETPLNEYAKRLWQSREVLLEYNPYDLLIDSYEAAYSSHERRISLPTESIVHSDNTPGLYHEKVHAVFDSLRSGGAESLLFGQINAAGDSSMWSSGRSHAYDRYMNLDEFAAYAEQATLLAQAAQQLASQTQSNLSSEDAIKRQLTEYLTIFETIASRTDVLLQTEALADSLANTDRFFASRRAFEQDVGSEAAVNASNAIITLSLTNTLEYEEQLLEQARTVLGISNEENPSTLRNMMMHTLFTNKVEQLQELAFALADTASPVATRDALGLEPLELSELSEIALELQSLVSEHYPAQGPELDARQLLINDPAALAHLLEHYPISDGTRRELIEDCVLAFLRDPGISAQCSEGESTPAATPISRLSMEGARLAPSAEFIREAQIIFNEQLTQGELHIFETIPLLLPMEVLEHPGAIAALETAISRADGEQLAALREAYDEKLQASIFDETVNRLWQEGESSPYTD